MKAMRFLLALQTGQQQDSRFLFNSDLLILEGDKLAFFMKYKVSPFNWR
jgi:hypothetical protein